MPKPWEVNEWYEDIKLYLEVGSVNNPLDRHEKRRVANIVYRFQIQRGLLDKDAGNV